MTIIRVRTQVRKRVFQTMRRCAHVALAACAAVALSLLVAFAGTNHSVALACGLGNTPTMLANGAPAMLYPVTKNTPIDQPIGLFALNYVAGQQVSFVEDLSRVSGAPAPNSFQWRWNFGDSTEYNTAISPKHTFAAAGTYNVRAQILDTSGGASTWTDLDSAQITVIGAALANAPTAKVTASATAVPIGGSITFDATGSRAADGGKLTYLWNFNDGSTDTGPRVTHTFAIQGQGIVALIVTDSRGARSVATSNLLVAPELTASATSVQSGAAVSFDATQSAPPPGQGAPAGFTWNFGDGSAEVTTQDPSATHTFTQAGAHTVTVRAGTAANAQVLALTTVTVAALPAAVAADQPRGGTNVALLVGIVIALLLAAGGGYFGIQAQRRRNALIRNRKAAMELARARAVNASKRGRRGPGGGAPPRARYPQNEGRPSRRDTH